MVVGQIEHGDIMKGLRSSSAVKLNTRKQKLKHRFEIIRKLGEGTCGKVQLGLNRETGQQVAVKAIKKSKIQTDDDLVRIRREIQIMSSVRHPSIIHIFEVFENKDKIVLVMEYAAGGELYDYIVEKRGLSEPDARRIFRQIAAAVYYCHKHKICHRDLKLENVLMDENGNAKIADFGLSNVFDGKSKLTTYCGSPLYASPEVVKGVPYLGPEVDCWSLGVLLYTLVYGAMPFDGSNFKRLVKQITCGEYAEPAEKSEASELIKCMLTPNPTKRFTIDEVCSHWWVNEGYDVSCLVVADELARQTPVRLDLLLTLAPCPKSSKSLVIDEDSLSLPLSDDEPPPLAGGDDGSGVSDVPDEDDDDESLLSESEPSKKASDRKKKKKHKPTDSEKEVKKSTKKKKEKGRKEGPVVAERPEEQALPKEFAEEIAKEQLSSDEKKKREEEAGDEGERAAVVPEPPDDDAAGDGEVPEDRGKEDLEQAKTPTPSGDPPSFPPPSAVAEVRPGIGRAALLVPSRTAPVGFGRRTPLFEEKSRTDSALVGREGGEGKEDGGKAEPPEDVEEEDSRTLEDDLTPIVDKGSLGSWPAEPEPEPEPEEPQPETEPAGEDTPATAAVVVGGAKKKSSVVISLVAPSSTTAEKRGPAPTFAVPSSAADAAKATVKSEVRFSVAGGGGGPPSSSSSFKPFAEFDPEKSSLLADQLGVKRVRDDADDVDDTEAGGRVPPRFVPERAAVWSGDERRSDAAARSARERPREEAEKPSHALPHLTIRPRPALQHSPREFIIPIALEEGGYAPTPTSSTSSMTELGSPPPPYPQRRPEFRSTSMETEESPGTAAAAAGRGGGRRFVSMTSVRSSSSSASLAGARAAGGGGGGGGYSLPPTPLTGRQPMFGLDQAAAATTTSASDMMDRMRRLMNRGGEEDVETATTEGGASGSFFRPRSLSGLKEGSGAAGTATSAPTARYRRYGSAWSGSALDGGDDGAVSETRSFVSKTKPTARYKITIQKSGSVSSTDDEDDDFDLLSADSLFNSMLSRVKAATRTWRAAREDQPSTTTTTATAEQRRAPQVHVRVARGRGEEEENVGGAELEEEEDEDDWFRRPMSSFFSSSGMGSPFGRPATAAARGGPGASAPSAVRSASSLGMSQRARSLLSSMWDDDEWSDFFRS